jgi:hypothetical protein
MCRSLALYDPPVVIVKQDALKESVDHGTQDASTNIYAGGSENDLRQSEPGTLS